MMLKAKVYALARLLLGRSGGKVGGGLALDLCDRSHFSLFGPVLTDYSKCSENRSRTRHNARCKLMFVVGG